MAFVENLMAILTFDKEKIGALADDESATVQAILIAFVASFVGFIPGFLQFMGTNDPTVQNAAMTVALTTFLTVILVFFLFSGIMAFVLRGFGGTATLIQCLRVFGFAQIWGLIGSLIDLVLSLANMDVGITFGTILGLVGLVVFIFGLTAFSGLSLGSAIIAAIIAYILAMIVVGIILAIILIMLLAAFLGAMTT